MQLRLLEALELLDSLLTPRGLRLNQEKTAMTSFDEGFCYLGTDFSRSFPPVDPRHDIKPELHRLGWFVFQSGVFRWDSEGGVVVSGH